MSIFSIDISILILRSNLCIYILDVDECAFGLSKCNLNRQDCVNLFGGYKCKNARCDKGLKLVNDRCVGKVDIKDNFFLTKSWQR